jgi:hypothetical protein
VDDQNITIMLHIKRDENESLNNERLREHDFGCECLTGEDYPAVPNSTRVSLWRLQILMSQLSFQPLSLVMCSKCALETVMPKAGSRNVDDSHYKGFFKCLKGPGFENVEDRYCERFEVYRGLC